MVNRIYHTLLVLLPSAILVSCQTKSIALVDSFRMSATEYEHLERRAADGDAEAAWHLLIHHELGTGNKKAAELWLRRAAVLKLPKAQSDLASRIKEDSFSPTGFGPNPREAVRSLLERAAQTEGDACNELASAYAEGYFGSSDHSKARIYFCQGANLHNRACWEELSRYYRHGQGGPRDDGEAYYWISLETRCVDPRSVSGEKSWETREEIASHLSLSEMEREWRRIDAFLSRVAAKEVVIDDYPFLSGAISEKSEVEGRRLSQQREDEHRKKWRSSNT
ncbi:MAG: tetratricopeptide repeat protein [Verrucomicrobiota bacterium]